VRVGRKRKALTHPSSHSGSRLPKQHVISVPTTTTPTTGLTKCNPLLTFPLLVVVLFVFHVDILDVAWLNDTRKELQWLAMANLAKHMDSQQMSSLRTAVHTETLLDDAHHTNIITLPTSSSSPLLQTVAASRSDRVVDNISHTSLPSSFDLPNTSNLSLTPSSSGLVLDTTSSRMLDTASLPFTLPSSSPTSLNSSSGLPFPFEDTRDGSHSFAANLRSTLSSSPSSSQRHGYQQQLSQSLSSTPFTVGGIQLDTSPLPFPLVASFNRRKMTPQQMNTRVTRINGEQEYGFHSAPSPLHPFRPPNIEHDAIFHETASISHNIGTPSLALGTPTRPSPSPLLSSSQSLAHVYTPSSLPQHSFGIRLPTRPSPLRTMSNSQPISSFPTQQHKHIASSSPILIAHSYGFELPS
jgi:hypothetical protein